MLLIVVEYTKEKRSKEYKNMLKNKEYPPFSVLMSVYKFEKPEYLDEALTSVENQTFPPNEIILVEDGPISTELKRIIYKHQKKFGKGFKDIVSKKSQGLGAALRLGTKYVSTNWIARMDSDDVSVPKRFEIQLEEIMKNPELAVIGGQVQEFAGNVSNIVGYRKVPTSEALLRQFIRWRSPFNHPSVMVNKDVLQTVGGYIPYGNLEDYYLWARVIAQNFHVLNVDQTLVKMRVDTGMYQRRGKLSNIKYFYRLRNYLYTHQLSSWSNKILGDLLVTGNILIPGTIRKLLYRHILHRKK